jgi:pimeloyl-ACP methyl ester carboxylesterase
MAMFALVHGAWGSGWHWGRVPAALRALGHEVVAPDLPCEDPGATFDDYAAVVLDALKDVDGEDVVVVGYSMGGNTAPLVAARRPVRELVYLAAIVPEPGMSLNDQIGRGDAMLRPEWMAGVELAEDRRSSRWVDFDVYHRVSCHDCEEPVARERFDRSRSQSNVPYGVPCSLTEPPDVPTRFVLCTEDRLLDNSFWHEAIPSRHGAQPVEMRASHAPMASRPEELARVLAAGSPS